MGLVLASAVWRYVASTCLVDNELKRQENSNCCNDSEKNFVLHKSGQLSMRKAGRLSIIFPILSQLEDQVHASFRAVKQPSEMPGRPALAAP